MKNPLKKPAPEPGRRSRTRQATNTRPTQSFSYYSRRANQDFGSSTGRQSSHDVSAIRTKVTSMGMQRLRALVGLLVLAVITISMITLSSKARITTLGSNMPPTNSDAYQTAADDFLHDSVASKSKITINTKKIAAQMQQKFPELTDVSVSVPLFGRRPTVAVAVAQSALVLSSSTGSFIVGTSGTVLSSSSQVDSSVRDALPTVSDQSGLPLDVHSRVLASDDVAFIQTVFAQLKAKNIPVSGITLPRSTGELDVQPTGQPYFVKFNLQSKTAKEQAGTYFATMARLQKDKVTPAQYIDVRVDGRAYYK